MIQVSYTVFSFYSNAVIWESERSYGGRPRATWKKIRHHIRLQSSFFELRRKLYIKEIKNIKFLQNAEADSARLMKVCEKTCCTNDIFFIKKTTIRGGLSVIKTTPTITARNKHNCNYREYCRNDDSTQRQLHHRHKEWTINRWSSAAIHSWATPFIQFIV